MTARLTTSTVTLTLAALVALAGCSTDDTASLSASSSAPASASAAADAVTIDDAWVKAADSGMSAAFGDIKNTGPDDVTVVSVTSTASSMLELHETVENESGAMVMRQKDGGFTIPAGGDLLLEPGANHIMLMDLAEPLKAGDEATFTLTFSDDSTYEFTAPAKDYSGANETYEEGDSEMDMGEMGMDHSGADHSDMDMGDE